PVRSGGARPHQPRVRTSAGDGRGMTELLQDWVTLQAETRPDAFAVVLREDRLTYGQLEARSNQLAGLLRDTGCKKGDRVCLLMPKSPTALVGLLGIYKADCIFVPLDLSNPAARLTRILESCESRCILAAGPVVHLLDELFSDAALRVSLSVRSEEHTSELQSRFDLVCRLLLEKKK